MIRRSLFAFIGVLLSGLAAAPLSAEVVRTSENGFIIRDSMVMEADTRETWLALISPAGWWSDTHTFSGDAANMTLTPTANGCFCERVPADDDENTVPLDGSVEHMRVILAIPDQALRMQSGLGPLQSEPVNAVLTVTLAEMEEGTRLIFEYAVSGDMRFEIPVISRLVDGVLSQQMAGLARSLGPDSSADISADISEDEEAGDGSEEPEVEEAAENDSASRASVDSAFEDMSDPE